MRKASLRISASILAFAVGGAAVAVAQGVPGTTSYAHVSKSSASSALLSGGSANPVATYNNACYATGGVALRNRTTGNISVSGCVTSPFMDVEAAWIYWALIWNEATPQASSIRITNTVTGATARLNAGAAIATGPSPCWGGTQIAIYKMPIPLWLANNGFGTSSKSYQLSMINPPGGNKDGSDPFVETPVYPLWEGASIVLIYNGTATVDVFDAGLAGSFIVAPFTYTLNLSGTSAVQTWDSIAADGQVGGALPLGGRTAILGISGETTTINGHKIVGPGPAPAPNSDFDGSSGWPLPQLWDDTGHDITVVGSTNALTITVGPPVGGGLSGDCMTGVANIVAR